MTAIRWLRNVARFRQKRNFYKFWFETLQERMHREDLIVDGRILVDLILKRWGCCEKVMNIQVL